MTDSMCIGKRLLGFLLWLIWIAAFSTVLHAQAPPIQIPQINIPQFPIPMDGQIQNQTPFILKMHIDAGLVSAEVSNCPLQNALLELAERTGVVFEIQSQINPLVSVNLYRVSLQEAIQRLASASNSVSLNTLVFYSQDVLEPDRIKLVRFFPRINQVPQPSIIFLGTGAVTKSNDRIDTPEQALKTLIESNKLETREKAIEALAASKSDFAPKALTYLISDASPEIRVAAIEGLAVLGAQTAISDILKTLKDEHPGVRLSAIKAIALLGDARNVKDLRPLSKDKDVSVAAEADIALRKLSARHP
jgi:hypothetical protein